MNKLLLSGSFLAMLLSGCNSTQAEAPQDAKLTRVNPGVITQLQQAIQTAKGGALVTLADDVFTKSAELLIDHATSKGPDGIPIMSAHSIPSEKFVLQKSADKCMLFYPKKELLVPLPNVECEVL
ncbi:hypothetical protein NQT69_17945 [Pseudoalteromonas shioyasakiensis]|uniref:hypothetical protein n=1 Tax=Pseudoalteromonas shioyasakiensis TaxID=1190813 RepID=UPI002118DE80|nr:hypothetical protein [Pseudoalteromonas shioyasakiensis]MCQ8879883.1 hypothetical protein [Pseudoalteromonas shioyasakiensis]